MAAHCGDLSLRHGKFGTYRRPMLNSVEAERPSHATALCAPNGYRLHNRCFVDRVFNGDGHRVCVDWL